MNQVAMRWVRTTPGERFRCTSRTVGRRLVWCQTVPGSAYGVFMSAAEIVAAFITAIEAKDIDGAVALLADDVSYENMPIDPVRGADAVAQVLAGFLAPASEVDWRIVDQWEVGDTVINERLDRFRIGDGWLELPVAGVFKVSDGRISLWRDYFDMGSYLSQMNALTGRGS